MIIKPDLMTFTDGTAVQAGGWDRRRGELYKAIIPHEYGGMPPDDVQTRTILRSRNRLRAWPGVTYLAYEVRVSFRNGRELSFTMSLWQPPGDGPFPALLDGDGCWRYFNDDVVRQVVDRGNIAVLFDRTEAAADNKDRYRDTGLYRLFPDAEFGALSAWAWAYHRCVDALTGLDFVRKDAIAATGHSRGGKCVLLAGATDSRIAVTNPNCSCAGGSGLHRLKAPGSERLDAFSEEGSIFWFGPALAQYRGRDGELPYDQHFLHALVAPRLLLVTEAYEDLMANPPGSYAACLAAREVYRLLSAPDNIGWTLREGGHAHLPADFDTLLDFMDRHLHRREIKRDFQRKLYPDLEKLLVPA